MLAELYRIIAKITSNYLSILLQPDSSRPGFYLK